MDIKLTVVHTASPELLAVLGGLVKGENKAPAPKSSTIKPAATVTSTTLTEDTSEEKLKLTTIRELATDLSKNKGIGTAVKALLAEFNCDGLSNLEKDQYEDFYTKLQKLKK